MGCSSSAQTQVKDCSRPTPKSPDANGLQTCDDLPITNENDIIPDQTKLAAMEEMEHGPHETKLSEEDADVLIPGITKCALSTCQRVDPEGTEPHPVASEEKFINREHLSTDLLEASKPQPVEPSEFGEPQGVTKVPGILLLETVQDSKPESVESSTRMTPEPGAEESVNLVEEIVKELLVAEEEELPKGETGEKMETEMHLEIVSEGSETKEEETGEATVATEIEPTNNEE
ncbi:glutamate-rich protein 5 isoform X2 [Varanus komodoensis]|uniref:glutamate-rich protein 5 isoform X2 n=1 Tax=Varanus komodoensis TaxID=61221 RepID=UPI001CF7D751|nr:glutamate-rich protein 5 isoform X2 [Varanus komodoensis]